MIDEWPIRGFGGSSKDHEFSVYGECGNCATSAIWHS